VFISYGSVKFVDRGEKFENGEATWLSKRESFHAFTPNFVSSGLWLRGVNISWIEELANSQALIQKVSSQNEISVNSNLLYDWKWN